MQQRMTKRVTAVELRTLLEEEGCTVVDVREGWEWARGRIAGSRHLPLRALRQEGADLSPGEPVVLVCKSGARSRQAAGVLKELGFSQVADLAGGIDSWKREGLELEKDPGQGGSAMGRLRMGAGLLALAGVAGSQWWPPAIYVSAVILAGMMLSLLAGWVVNPPADASSEAACSDSGG